MTPGDVRTQAQTSADSRSTTRPWQGARGELLVAAAAFVLIALLAVSAVTYLSSKAPGGVRAGARTAAAGPIEITLLHTNDTLGYVDPCG